MVHLSVGHWIGLCLALCVFVYLTIRAARTTKTADGYSLNGRKAGPMMVSGSIVGTCVAGVSTIGTAQMAYAFGISGWWFTFGVGISLIIMAAFYARPLRQSKLETLPQFLGQYYGQSADLSASMATSIGTLLSMVASALAGIALVSLMFGIPGWAAAVIIAVLALASVFYGGIKGAGAVGLLKITVIWVTLMIAGILAVIYLARMPDFSARFPADVWFNPFARGIPTSLANFFSTVIGILCTQTHLQAIFAARDVKAAKRGVRMAALFTMPIGLPSIAIGMYMHHAFPHIEAIYALPLFMETYLPSWLGGIGLAGLLFSVVGSLSGFSLGIGTVVASDFCRGWAHITDNKRILRLNRFTVLVTVALAMGIALAASGTQVLDWNYLSLALRSGGIFLPMALAIFWPRHLPGLWAAASIAISSFLAFAGRFFWHWTLDPTYIAVLCSIVLVGAGLIIARKSRLASSAAK